MSSLRLGKYTTDTAPRSPLVMGCFNVTPDFIFRWRTFVFYLRAAHRTGGTRMAAEGADDIHRVSGESTTPRRPPPSRSSHYYLRRCSSHPAAIPSPFSPPAPPPT
jgi:dihydropteroate synthase